MQTSFPCLMCPCFFTFQIAEFTKECSALWKDMNDTTKKPFNDKAETDKLRYQKEVGT